jgi:hypothetical protein
MPAAPPISAHAIVAADSYRFSPIAARRQHAPLLDLRFDARCHACRRMRFRQAARRRRHFRFTRRALRLLPPAVISPFRSPRCAPPLLTPPLPHFDRCRRSYILTRYSAIAAGCRDARFQPLHRRRFWRQRRAASRRRCALRHAEARCRRRRRRERHQLFFASGTALPMPPVYLPPPRGKSILMPSPTPLPMPDLCRHAAAAVFA